VNLIALLLGLFLEHRLTRLFSLRELRWFDAYFDAATGIVRRPSVPLALGVVVAAVLLPVLPVLAVSLAFRELLFGLPYVCFAVLMLLVSLGPRNLQEDVEDFASARRSGDTGEAERLAKAMVEHDLPLSPRDRTERLAQSIFVQANNRLFGVIFWFVVGGLAGFGPEAAWLFRVSDLLRRRETFEADRRGGQDPVALAVVKAVSLLHGLLAWVPARLLALGYAFVGRFDQALSDWKGYLSGCREPYFAATDAVLACVGIAALGPPAADQSAMPCPPAPGVTSVHLQQAARAEQALVLVQRTLWLWVTGIAVMTLVGSIR
jgi:AmpE protein